MKGDVVGVVQHLVATCLFCGDTPEANTLVGKENGGGGQQELTNLEDGVQTPTLKQQNPPTEQTDGREENVVVP